MAKRQKLAPAELADFLEGAAASDSFATELGLGEVGGEQYLHTGEAAAHMDTGELTEACAFLSHALLGGSGEAAQLVAEAAEEVEQEPWLPEAKLMVRCCGRLSALTSAAGSAGAQPHQNAARKAAREAKLLSDRMRQAAVKVMENVSCLHHRTTPLLDSIMPNLTMLSVCSWSNVKTNDTLSC